MCLASTIICANNYILLECVITLGTRKVKMMQVKAPQAMILVATARTQSSAAHIEGLVMSGARYTTLTVALIRVYCTPKTPHTTTA